jgi:hypothetical protein
MQQGVAGILEISSPNEVSIIDTKGRTIVLKKPPNVLSQYKLIETVGAETAKNDVFMGMSLPFLYMISIDNFPVSINSKTELYALISRFSDDDIRLIGQEINKHFAVDEEEEKEKVKK